MKLYTEQQVMEMLRIAKHTYELIDNIMNEFNEIELPTDEQIDDFADDNTTTLELYVGFKSGAKWMRDKIKRSEQ